MRMLRAIVLCFGVVLLGGAPAVAQSTAAPDPTEMAEIRDELLGLRAEIDTLRQLIITESTGGTGSAGIGPAILRLDRLEAELRLINGRVEQLANYVDRVVTDGTTRIGDLEFRLTELAGGDLAAIPDTPRLGTVAPNASAEATPTPEATEMASVTEEIDPNAPRVVPPKPRKKPGGEVPADDPDEPVAEASPAAVPTEEPMIDPDVALAVAEKSDFELAMASFEAGDMAGAIILFGSFLADYPGGPLSVEALFHLGDAQSKLGQHREAARSYLDAFTAAPSGRRAPQALLRIGIALGELDQTEQACQTLQEVIHRYPGHPAAGEAQSQSLAMNCG